MANVQRETTAKVVGFCCMTFEEAVDDLRQGRAVSRIAWGNPHAFVRLARQSERGSAPARADQPLAVLTPRPLDKADLAADDWFTVGTVN